MLLRREVHEIVPAGEDKTNLEKTTRTKTLIGCFLYATTCRLMSIVFRRMLHGRIGRSIVGLLACVRAWG
jgi:hypothetical protein